MAKLTQFIQTLNLSFSDGNLDGIGAVSPLSPFIPATPKKPRKNKRMKIKEVGKVYDPRNGCLWCKEDADPLSHLNEKELEYENRLDPHGRPLHTPQKHKNTQTSLPRSLSPTGKPVRPEHENIQTNLPRWTSPLPPEKREKLKLCKVCYKRYYLLLRTPKWRETSRRWLNQNPLCAMCKVKASTDVHHVQEWSYRPDLFWNDSNWCPLCHSCHSSVTSSTAPLCPISTSLGVRHR